LVTVKQTTANIWRLHEQGYYMVDPVNVYVKSDRKAVMGRGLASQIVNKYPEVADIYGELLLGWVRPGLDPGKRVLNLGDLNKFELIQADFERHLIFFPTKLMWDLNSDLALIKMSFEALKGWMKRNPGVGKIALPRVGAGNGKLDWEKQVKPVVRAFLESLSDEDRAKFVIVHPPEYLEAMGY
jgi:hypothetical protein